MNRLWLTVFLLSLTVLAQASITILEQTDTQLLIEYRLGDYTLSRQADYIRIDAQAMDYPSLTGAPLLPYSETQIGIPPDGWITATVISASSHTVGLEGRLLPVPRIWMDEEISHSSYDIVESYYLPYDTPLLAPLEPGGFRGFSYVPLEIHPFSYVGDRQLKVIEQALIRIDISGNTNYRGDAVADELSNAMLGKLLNQAQTINWHSTQRDPVNYADFSKSDYWLRVETNQEGMFKLMPAQLTDFPIGDIDPRSLRMFSTGGNLLPFTIVTPGAEFKEVPIRVEGESDGIFDTQDYIVFYGTTRDGLSKNQSLQSSPTFYNPYSGNAVFWLTFGSEEAYANPPLRMQDIPQQTTWTVVTSTTTDQERLETETHRRLTYGFDWFMTRMFGTYTAEYQFDIDLAGLDVSQAQKLSFMMQQEDVDSNIWHYISVYVNDVPVTAASSGSEVFSWRGTGEYVFFRNVNNFVSGANTIRIKVIRTGTDNLFLNWITVDHTRSINKTNEQCSVSQLALNYGVPVRYSLNSNVNTVIYRVNSFSDVALVPLQADEPDDYFVSEGSSETKYILSTDAELFDPVNIASIEPPTLAENDTQIDNVIITADEYAAQAQSLADMYLQDLGTRSIVVKQSDVFNQFNGGHPDPAAIRQFLRYTYQNYPAPTLSSVTLMGLGTIDWRNFSGQAGSKNKIIIYQRNSIASDDYFVMLTQAAHPELAVGRYPVSNTNELNNMLSNFQDYTENPQGGWWRNSMVFLGDDLFNGSSTSYENIHTRQTQDAGDVVHPSILVDKIFAWDYEYDEFQNKPGARDDMISAINDGRLVWFYIGHGSYDKLGAEDYFNGASDMGRFNNPNKLPLFMAASCSVSHYDYWGFESLGQKTVLLNNAGAIASYSATRISAPYNNAPMMELLLDNLANDRNYVGYAIIAAKTQYTQSNENDATYVLLGDPLLRIIPPQRSDDLTIEENTGDEILNARELAVITGNFSASETSGEAQVKVFNNEIEYDLDWQTHVSHRGTTLFQGSASASGGAYESSFIVPDDVTTGNTGLIAAYLWDQDTMQDYVNFHYPQSLNDQAVTAVNPDAPSIQIYLGNMDFRPGDTVGTNTTLFAKISDSNGINVTGSSGHNILLVLDNSLQPLPVTSYFSYDLDSYTQGVLTYPFNDLDVGSHTLQVIAFDNFNQPSVASTTFIVKNSGDLAIERFLLYPNPMTTSTSLTFMLSLDSALTVDFYTVTGKKVSSTEAIGKQGFNSVPWNGRDSQGARLANGTYFVKIRAESEGKKAEKTERLVIYN